MLTVSAMPRSMPILMTWSPMMSATLNPTASTPGDSAESGPRRSAVLHAFTRMVEEAPGWHVVSRFENPLRGNWTIVAWQDGATRPGEIDPGEIVIIRQCRPARAIILNTPHAPGSDRQAMTVEHVSHEDFPSQVHRGLDYRAVPVSRPDDPDAPRLLGSMLGMPVRESGNTGSRLISRVE